MWPPSKKASQIYRPKCAWNTVNTTVFVENIGFFWGGHHIYIYIHKRHPRIYMLCLTSMNLTANIECISGASNQKLPSCSSVHVDFLQIPSAKPQWISSGITWWFVVFEKNNRTRLVQPTPCLSCGCNAVELSQWCTLLSHEKGLGPVFGASCAEWF